MIRRMKTSVIYSIKVSEHQLHIKAVTDKGRFLFSILTFKLCFCLHSRNRFKLWHSCKYSLFNEVGNSARRETPFSAARVITEVSSGRDGYGVCVMYTLGHGSLKQLIFPNSGKMKKRSTFPRDCNSW